MKRIMMLYMIAVLLISGTVGYAQCVSMDSAFYTHEQLMEDAQALCAQYANFVELERIGVSADQREIIALRIGNRAAEHRFIVQAAIHGREYINSLIAMLQAENLLEELYSGKLNLDQNAFCIYIVPMMNPDGVSLSQFGIDAIRDADLKKSLRQICSREAQADNYWKRWKANAEGVDLNRNFPQFWQEYIGNAAPSSEKYKGQAPVCAPETQAILALIEKVDPDCVISYHSAGNCVYWEYGCSGDTWQKNAELALIASIVTGYPMQSCYANGQDAAGCSDYMVLTQNRAAITIENGSGACPLEDGAIASIWRANRYLLPALIRHYTTEAYSDT